MGIPNYKNPEFWRRGYQTLGASIAIFGVLIGRTPASSAITAYSQIDRTSGSDPSSAGKPPAVVLSPSGVESSASSFDTEYYSRRTHLLGEQTWRLYYASNR